MVQHKWLFYASLYIRKGSNNSFTILPKTKKLPIEAVFVAYTFLSITKE